MLKNSRSTSTGAYCNRKSTKRGRCSDEGGFFSSKMYLLQGRRLDICPEVAGERIDFLVDSDINTFLSLFSSKNILLTADLPHRG